MEIAICGAIKTAQQNLQKKSNEKKNNLHNGKF
jgi:hypothetical protein